MLGPVRDVVAAPSRDRNEAGGSDADLIEERAIFLDDSLVHGAVPANQIHLVDDHSELANAEQRHHVAMAAGILLYPFGRVDHQQRSLGPGGTRDHVLEELDVARGIENQIVPLLALEEHPGGIDGDALGLLVLQGIEQEGILERLRVQLALGANLLQLPFGKRVGVGQQPAYDGALAVIDVADDHDVHPLLPFGPGRCRGRRSS